MSDTRDGPADKLRAPHEAQEAHALHDAAIAARYRAASLEMPGAAADAAILAQARAAARLMAEATGESTAHAAGGAANDASWSRRLRAPLALAACAVLAVGIVTRISVEAPEAMRGEAPAAASAERRAAGAPVTASAPGASAPAVALATPPASADTAIPSAARSAAESRPVAEPPPESVRPRAQRAGAAVPTVPAVPAQMPVARAAPAQDVPPLQERKLRESAVADATSPGPRELPALAKGTEPAAPAAADSLRASAAAPPAAASAPASAPASASGSGSSAESSAVARADKRTIARTDHSAAPGAGPPASGGVMRKSEAVQIFSAEQETALAPERWLAYLIDLRRSGQHAAADASLARFRARYPDHAVPPGARGPQPFPAEVK